LIWYVLPLEWGKQKPERNSKQCIHIRDKKARLSATKCQSGTGRVADDFGCITKALILIQFAFLFYFAFLSLAIFSNSLIQSSDLLFECICGTLHWVSKQCFEGCFLLQEIGVDGWGEITIKHLCKKKPQKSFK
jgi:hypothetical protein